MNKAVVLINEWAEFDNQHPDADIEEFCRHYLIKKSEERNQQKISDGVEPPQTENLLLKLMGRITGIGKIYFREALSDIPEIELEGFFYLNSIMHLGESRKTDIINHHFSELSTGIDTLNRLKHEKLIKERTDPSDKRARLVSITEKGRKILFQCYRRMAKVGSILFDEVSEEDQKLCIQILKVVEIKHSRLALKVKSEGLGKVF